MTTNQPKSNDTPPEIVLDQYLYEGFELKRYWFNGYETASKKEGFDVKKYGADFTDALNVWYRKVVNYLAANLPEKHLLYHFVEPKNSAFHMPHPLDNQVHALDRYLPALEDIILWLKDRTALQTRREIAELELQADILYQVRFSWHTREIKVNDMLLAKPNSDSKAMNFFEYMYDHPNTPIKVSDIETATKCELAASIQDILRDLNFKGYFRTVFFPKTNKNMAMFINPITKAYFIKQELPMLEINNNEKLRDGTSTNAT